jgi:hypothetical protein
MNEPAFPTNYFYDQENEHEILPMPGMTLRDYFAAKAMAVIMPTVVEILQKQAMSTEKTDQLKNGAAAACYGMADAMLKARQE